ncbi:hypothetical protein [Roseateles agri]|uniref:hypothetical protein n=1 Tax=Roseateles agri TaxID=3098619 RepID=UPI002A59D19F|nr:hypothetical protein [Paucibacter sp. R3-3]
MALLTIGFAQRVVDGLAAHALQRAALGADRFQQFIGSAKSAETTFVAPLALSFVEASNFS